MEVHRKHVVETLLSHLHIAKLNGRGTRDEFTSIKKVCYVWTDEETE